MLKKEWLSDLDILEICGLVNCEEYTPRESPKCIETNNIEKQITTESRNTSILTQEARVNIELIIKCMSEQKTTLPFQRNLDWKKV